MKLKTVLPGIILIILGIGLFVYYDLNIRPDKEAREFIVEASMISERGDKNSINQAISLYTKVIAKYPKSNLIPDAYFHIGRCYEKLGLYRLAKLKYIYVIKNSGKNISDELKRELPIRIAHIKVLKQYSEEAINQLYSLLNSNYNKEFRSRVYSELGHTYLKQGEYKRAKRMFDISISEFGSNEEAILGKARSFKRMGDDDKAYNLYEHFLKYYGAVSQYTSDVKKSYKEQAYKSGIDSFRKGHYNKAISYFNRVLNNFSSDRLGENSLYWIGECYYAIRSFSRSIDYFNRVLLNSYYHKDQDARIKKGYAYFSMKKFDLAAREFQTYLRHYPNGIHARIARNWKEMSTKELLYRIKSKKPPKTIKPKKPVQEEVEDELELELEDEELLEEEGDVEKDEEISGNQYQKMYGEKIRLENVAEL